MKSCLLPGSFFCSFSSPPSCEAHPPHMCRQHTHTCWIYLHFTSAPYHSRQTASKKGMARSSHQATHRSEGKFLPKSTHFPICFRFHHGQCAVSDRDQCTARTKQKRSTHEDVPRQQRARERLTVQVLWVMREDPTSRHPPSSHSRTRMDVNYEYHHQ